ncbi:MAG: hypothetical protein NC180_09745 [Muribaculaceae bacterium]|nr:hypothetical protein [Roseburia sp.]MCM1431811.1 hypothetical protein [Muribaculaceae bacterium]MCM1493492.1 hypothetical protein [Muribaculaceae bacterium]
MREIKKMKRLPLVMLLCILQIFILVGAPLRAKAATNEMNIYALYLEEDVKGDSVLLESRGKYLLMDLGADVHVDAVISHLKEIGVSRVSCYFSHLHIDHLGAPDGSDYAYGLRRLVSAGIAIDQVYLPSPTLIPKSPRYTYRFQALENYAPGNYTITYLNVGDRIQVGNATGEIIGPLNVYSLSTTHGEAEDDAMTHYENNCCLAAIFSCGSTRFFTAGDCMDEEADMLVRSYGTRLKCDIMKLNHHGTGSGNSEALIDLIAPKYAFAQNTGQTGVKDTNGHWLTYAATKNASKYGMCYLTGNEKKTLIYHVEDGNITLYQGKNMFDADRLTGWQHFYGADGKNRTVDTYYFDGAGTPVTGVHKIKGAYYNFDSSGAMIFGAYNDSGEYSPWRNYDKGKRCYMLSEDGLFAEMQVGFQLVNNHLYYFDEEGYRMVAEEDKSFVTMGGYEYLMGKTGIIKHSTFFYIDGKKYYADAKGHILKDGKKKVGKRYFIFLEDGSVVRAGDEDFIEYDYLGKTYAIASGGDIQISEIVPFGGDEYYFGSDGNMKKDYIATVDGCRYYFDVNGVMAYDMLIDYKGKTYYFGSSGEMVISKKKMLDEDYYYFDKNGEMVKDKKIKIGSRYYYFNKNGKMVMDKVVTIDGKRYYFDEDGIMIRKDYVTFPSGNIYYCDGNGVMKKVTEEEAA